MRYLHFCSDFQGYEGKRLDNKVKVNFKLYDVTNWEASNYNIHYCPLLHKGEGRGEKKATHEKHSLIRGKWFSLNQTKPAFLDGESLISGLEDISKLKHFRKIFKIGN